MIINLALKILGIHPNEYEMVKSFLHSYRNSFMSEQRIEYPTPERYIVVWEFKLVK